MNRQGASPSRRQSDPTGVGYSKNFLQRLAHILVAAGHSPQQLSREFAEVCRDLKEPLRRLDPAYLNFVSDLPHVIAHWYADPQYLDPAGFPIALPLHASSGPTLSALIERVLPREQPEQVVEALLQLRALRRRRARFLPIARQLHFRHLTAFAHGLTALLGILSTLQHNLTAHPRRTLLEKAAINPRFPASALPAYHRRLKRFGQQFLDTVDDDMRLQETSSRSRRTRRLGIGVYVFEEPDYLANSRNTSSRKRRARPARGSR